MRLLSHGNPFLEDPDEQFLLQPRTDYFYALHASEFGGPVLCACVDYHFTAEPLLLLDISTSQEQHLQLTGAALARQTFDELTCWKGGIL